MQWWFGMWQMAELEKSSKEGMPCWERVLPGYRALPTKQQLLGHTRPSPISSSGQQSPRSCKRFPSQASPCWDQKKWLCQACTTAVEMLEPYISLPSRFNTQIWPLTPAFLGRSSLGGIGVRPSPWAPAILLGGQSQPLVSALDWSLGICDVIPSPCCCRS